METKQSESLIFQRKRYDEEASEYEAHHGDALSQRYRDEFIRRKLLPFNLDGKSVLDAMCASGIETGFLLQQGATVTGLDISTANVELYKGKWGCECVVSSIHKTEFPEALFDVVYIFGGLHHVLPLLDETLTEVHRLLKPGGYLVFVEPNKDTWLNRLRMLWYRLDNRFHETEEAISYNELLRPKLSIGFEEELVFSGGNIAYLFIAQSLILRVPFQLKRLLYGPLSRAERLLEMLPFTPKLFIAGRWRKI
ncbi:MAG: class I SAM-dependent methyltransferase [Sulfuricella sp.]|nr:class I SAM-dependent methyltransferase [Sulfuricella sp.]